MKRSETKRKVEDLGKFMVYHFLPEVAPPLPPTLVDGSEVQRTFLTNANPLDAP